MGKLRGADGVHYYESDTVVCEPLNDSPVYAQIDGEPLTRLPVEFKIVPRALKLLVPSDSLTAKTAAGLTPCS
jgi:diacylglycerol kinase family enzyme